MVQCKKKLISNVITIISKIQAPKSWGRDCVITNLQTIEIVSCVTPQSVKLIFISLPARAYCEAAPFAGGVKGIKVDDSFLSLHTCIDYTQLYVVHLWHVAGICFQSNKVKVMGLVTPCDTETQKHF